MAARELAPNILVAQSGCAGGHERSASLNLSATLGGLPLALEQAAAYCERLGFRHFPTMLGGSLAVPGKYP